MSNSITAGHLGEVSIGNGGWMLLGCMLVLAAGPRPTGFIGRFAAFMADQNVNERGLGTCGFDLAELGWSDDFDTERSDLLALVARAQAEYRWHLLSPNPERMHGYLDRVEHLIRSLSSRPEPLAREWNQWPTRVTEPCPVHDVVTGEDYGCLVCSELGSTIG